MPQYQAFKPPTLVPQIEGASDGPTLFFIQGWPDDLSLWDDLVGALRDRYRCVRVNLPNYPGAEYRRWGFSHDEIVEGMARCIRQVSPGGPLAIVAHDWGAVWSYRLHHRYPELVSHLVALDIGPEVKPSPREAAFIAAYQWWLLAAFVVGGGIGDWMTRRMAGLAGAPQHAASSSRMNYPYLHTWKELVTGTAPNLAAYAPEVPMMIAYAANKPARFHTERWLEFVRARPQSQVVELSDASHWVTLDPWLTEVVAAFLDRAHA